LLIYNASCSKFVGIMTCGECRAAYSGNPWSPTILTSIFQSNQAQWYDPSSGVQKFYCKSPDTYRGFPFPDAETWPKIP
jgi:hypothetical protein